jgi:hypothetical protein
VGNRNVLWINPKAADTRAAFGRAGRRLVLARHAPEVVARAHVKLYAELIDAGRSLKTA